MSQRIMFAPRTTPRNYTTMIKPEHNRHRPPLAALRACVWLALLLCLVGREAFASGGDAWHFADHAYRREVLLPPDPAARTNAPIFLDLTQIDQADVSSIKVDEITAAGAAVTCDAAAYAQPSGRAPRAYWVATGSTAANQQRRFLVYYNKVASAPAYAYNWNRTGQTFGGSQSATAGGSKMTYLLKSDRLEFKRTANSTQANAADPLKQGTFFNRNPTKEDFTHLTDLKTGFSPIDGFSLNYSFVPFASSIGFDFGKQFFDWVKFDRNGPTGSMIMQFSIKDMLAHKMELSHRLFKGQPLLELAITVKPDSGQALTFSRDAYHARQVYWKSSFSPTRIQSDCLGDVAYNQNDEVKTWEVLYGTDSNALGLFTFRPSHKRASTSLKALMEFYELAAQNDSFFTYFAIGSRSEVVALFKTMKRGYPLSEEQRQQFDITKPAAGSCLIPGEQLTVTVEGPTLGASLKLTVQYPDGSKKDYSPSGGSATAKPFNLGVISASDKFGVWTLTAVSGSTSRSRTININKPAHPCVIFTQGELNQMRSRWTTDPRYLDSPTNVHLGILGHLRDEALKVYNIGPAPASLASDEEPRDHGRYLIHYGALLLMDPNHQDLRDRMWADFKTIINWKNWDPIGTESPAFSNDPVGRGEVLQSLALVYDWHYGDLSVANRRLYAERLATLADQQIRLDCVGAFAPRWESYWQSNNRYFMMNAGLATVERAVRAEIPAARRDAWRNKLDINYSNVTKSLSPDGATNEGYSYNSMANIALLTWAETRRLGGDSQAFNKSTWFGNASAYELYGMLPGRVCNFGGNISFGNCDQIPFNSHQMLMGLLSLRRNDPVAQWIAEDSIFTRVAQFRPYWIAYNRPKIDLHTRPNWHLFSTRGLFIFRSSWDNNAMYFAIKCGQIWGGHEHPDTGTFIIHRAGFPYIAAPAYVYKNALEDENIIIANGKGLLGRSDIGYSDAVDPANSGKLEKVLGSPGYFNILASLAPAYEAGSNLTSFKREFIGFGDLIILRDQLQASAASSFKQLLHGYKTDEQVSTTPYDPFQYPTDQVFFSQGAGWWRLYPNKQSNPNEWMTMLDLSRNNWATSTETWTVAPHYKPGYSATNSHANNSKKLSYPIGIQLARTVTGTTSAGSLQVFHFRSDQFKARRWNDTVADDGVVVYDAGNMQTRIKVVWPKGGNLLSSAAGSEGLTVKGVMAMRNYDAKLYGGRDLTRLRDDSAAGEKVDLISAAAPITIEANFAGGGREAWFTSTQTTQVTFYHPQALKKAYVNGQVTGFTRSGANIILQLPAAPQGAQLLTSNLTYAENWGGYR